MSELLLFRLRSESWKIAEAEAETKKSEVAS